MADTELDMETNYPLDDEGEHPVGVERDVSLAKDGGLLKKVLVKGEGFATPEAGDEVSGAAACMCPVVSG